MHAAHLQNFALHVTAMTVGKTRRGTTFRRNEPAASASEVRKSPRGTPRPARTLADAQPPRETRTTAVPERPSSPSLPAGQPPTLRTLQPHAGGSRGQRSVRSADDFQSPHVPTSPRGSSIRSQGSPRTFFRGSRGGRSAGKQIVTRSRSPSPLPSLLEGDDGGLLQRVGNRLMKETVPTAYTRQQLETVLQKCIADATLDSERPEATKEGWEAFLRLLRDW